MIYCDNKSGILLVENLVFHYKSKHIEIQYHFIQDMVQRGAVKLHHISIDEKILDIFAKYFPKGNFLVFREKLGLMDVTPFDLLIEDTEPSLSPCLSSQGVELRQRAPRVERSWTIGYYPYLLPIGLDVFLPYIGICRVCPS